MRSQFAYGATRTLFEEVGFTYEHSKSEGELRDVEDRRLAVMACVSRSVFASARSGNSPMGGDATEATVAGDAKGGTMPTIQEAATEFLAHKRVAVTGVSRKPQSHGSNVVYKRLRDRGYEVFAVNPNATEVEGDPAYHDLHAIPGGVEAVVIGTRPEMAEQTVRECTDLGIQHVWMHRSYGAGSVSDAATEYGREHGIAVIDGGCPCMFGPTADLGHKAMRFVFTWTGNVPKDV